MFVRFVFVASLCLLAHGAAAGALAERVAAATAEAKRQPDADVFSKPLWRCYGGLDDRKTVVHSADFMDDAMQTTRKGCRLGGGAVARAPQSPTISAGRPVVA